MKEDEKGQALLIVLAIVAFAGLVITPFLSHAGTNLLGSRQYGEAMTQQYSADAGVEHAIWNLVYGGLADNLTDPGDNTSYQLGEAINGIVPDITVIKSDNSTYEVTSVSGNNSIQAIIEISGENVTIYQWQLSPWQ
jgi:hypothetical protein